MKCKNCWSHALNDAPETGLCDVCNQKSKVDHLRAVNAELLDALEYLYNWCVKETKAGGYLGPGHEWPHARSIIAKHRG